MLKRIFTLFVLTLLLAIPASASHLMGGEITWKCLGNGDFVFRMKLYRDCNGINGSTSATLTVHNHPTVSNIFLNLVSQTDISPVCNGMGPTITCSGAQSQSGWPSSLTPMPGAVEEFVYESVPTNLAGVPPPQGWIFTYSSCCRNSSITNIVNPGSAGFTLRAIMYPYNGQNTGTCYDSSPEFLESPRTIICTSYPFTYNHNAVDAELDSLAYSWAEPLDQMLTGTYNPPANPSLCGFTGGYSFNSPLPGPAQNPSNIPATINPNTGEISYTSFTPGNFVTAIKVEAWKCGQKVAEIFREIQVVLLACGSNSPPTVTPPFQDINGNYTLFADTVYAGQVATFNLAATDFQTLPNGNPQTLTMTATGNQFGAGFTSTTTGCLNPPCATLSPALPVSAPFGVTTSFNWQTDCNHVAWTNGCGVQSNTYNFVIRTQDDYCPAPAQNIATISITVLPLPTVLSPEVRCLAVAPNGDVTLTWAQPADTANTFNSYHIFTSTNPNGPYTPLDSIFTITQTSYTHTGAGGNAGQVYYTVHTRSGCNPIMPALDTVSTIFLNLTNNGNGTASLSWNNIGNPAPPTQSPWFRIWREHPAGTWTLIDSTQSLTYLDTIAVCNDWVNYRIEIADSIGCASVSNVTGSQFADNLVPATPVIDTVSVDANGNAVLGWQQNTSADVTGYIIYQYVNGVWTAIDTVWGLGVTAYQNANSNADQSSEQYSIAAVDSCGNLSSFSAVHHSIFVNYALDLCDATVSMSWNSYINMLPGLGGYNVYASQDGAPFQLLGSTAPGDTVFTHTGLQQFSTYCYYVVAYSSTNSETASSNSFCVYASVPQQPTFNYLKVASVDGPQAVKVEVYVDVAADVIRYDVYRSDDQGATFNLIGNVPAAPPQNIVTYWDYTAQTDQQSYYYKVMAVDSCGDNALISNVGRTIHLSAQANEGTTNTLYWNDYESWLGQVSTYTIYRSIDNSSLQPIATVPFSNAGQNVYTDDVSAYIHMLGRFSYYIEAVEGGGNPYTFTDTSYSNIAEVVQEHLLFIPNAFVPKGVNTTFLPSTGFIDLSEYELSVFDRWGGEIFKTNDPSLGWDGTFHNQKCPGGVYVYLLTIKTSKGQYIERKGTVTLIR